MIVKPGIIVNPETIYLSLSRIQLAPFSECMYGYAYQYLLVCHFVIIWPQYSPFFSAVLLSSEGKPSGSYLILAFPITF